MKYSGSKAVRKDQHISVGVLVLNRYYAAIRIIPARRAFRLLWKNSAEAVEQEAGEYRTFDLTGWLDHSREHGSRPRKYERINTPNLPVLVPPPGHDDHLGHQVSKAMGQHRTAIRLYVRCWVLYQNPNSKT